jgi:hypothetical protein
MSSPTKFFRALFSRTSVRPRSPAEWEQARGATTDTVAPAKSEAASVVAEIAPISLTCFVESIDPECIGLSLERLREVREELARLRSIPPLEAYVLCLEKLVAYGAGE